MAKFIKGSKAAKDFMARLRAARKGAKKKVKTVKKTVNTKIKKHKAKATRIKKAVFSGETHTDNKSHNYHISISGVGNEVFKDYIKQVEIEMKGQNFWVKKLKTYYKKPIEFNDVCFALKYKAKKMQEIVGELQQKYNFNR